MTIEEHVPKPLSQVKVVFCGDVRNNMSYAWMQGCAKMGMNFTAYGPKELAEQIDPDVIRRTKEVAEKTGAVIEISSDENSLAGADVIYTDIWASMGEEDQIPARVKIAHSLQSDGRDAEKTGNKDVIFMHACLRSTILKRLWPKSRTKKATIYAKSPTKYSDQRIQKYLTKRKTGCTPSNQ